MVSIRSTSEIVQNLLDFFKLVQPNASVNPGSVIRDLLIDPQASQLSLLYDELGTISNKQSLSLVSGTDLDKLAKNFGIARTQSTFANGVVLLTFSSLASPISINQGDIVIAQNGFSFAAVAGLVVAPSAINYYKSISSKFRSQLNTAGITDLYAVEVTVTATTAGSSGNIGAYTINKTHIVGVSNVTNVNAFTGGANQENDAIFRNRVLSSFSGSSVGTSLGYKNAALALSGVLDAVVIEPGSALMTRDGTIVSANGLITSEGTGGKVDIAILGTNLQENTDSFIYIDKSNSNDPTNIKNNFVLGQIAADINKTINKKRIDDITNNILPAQPVEQILQITGSSSGSNFIEKTIDSLGRTSGNYELLKDTGAYAGSPFGFDTFHWISNKVSLFEDNKVKGQFNGQDSATFSDLLEISKVQQILPITNEASVITSDRSIIQLLHTPVANVTRVFNVNTGERYIVTNQNLDSTGIYNTTGRIQISGSTLPSPNQILQVDYSWVIYYDQYSDYDGLKNTLNARNVNDSIDWGYSSLIKDEYIIFTENVSNNYFVGIASTPITSVISAKTFTEINGLISTVASGVFTNRLSIVLNNLSIKTLSINSIKWSNTNSELYVTAQNDGSFISTAIVIGTQVLYKTTIILPTDTVGKSGDYASCSLNETEVFYTSSSTGASSGTQITIPSTQIPTSATVTLKVSYIANVNNLYSASLTSLPSSRQGSSFTNSNNNGFNNFSIINNFKRDNLIVQKNLSDQFYIELNALSTDYSINVSNVLSILRLSDGFELWNSSNFGSITIGTSLNYQVILSGYNSPIIGDRVLVIYSTTDIKRFQPFSFNNKIIISRKDQLSIDPETSKFYININKFVSETSIHFDIIEPNTNTSLFSASDGYLNPGSSTATLLSSTSFTPLEDILNKQIQIVNANNDGLYNIINYVASTNLITISNLLNKIDVNQVSIIRASDGKEIWSTFGIIDITNNKLLLPANIVASVNDFVYLIIFKYSSLRKSPTKISSSITDSLINPGVLFLSGTTLTKALDIIFTATSSGLQLNLNEAARKNLKLTSAETISNNIKLAKIAKLEKVITVSSSDDNVLEVLATYDIKNITIQNNLLYNDICLQNTSLNNLDFILPSTVNNKLNSIKLGDKLRITFYYTNDNDSENLSYTKNGTLYTNKSFAIINKIYVNSGFKSSNNTKLSMSNFTQPNIGSRYKAFYDYTAPKQNERIVIKYNFNKLISDATLSIEKSRPITADVLVKSARLVELDLTMNIVLSDGFSTSSTTVVQNLKNKLSGLLTSTNLGGIIDQVTLITAAQGINGVARARILYFNKVGGLGQILVMTAQADQYFAPNNIIINIETR